MNGTITKTTLKSGKASWGYVFDKGKSEDGKRNQETKQGFSKKSEAEDALRKAIEEFTAPTKRQPSDQPFGQFFQEWLDHRGKHDWAPKTRECNGERASYAIKKFGLIPLSQLTARQLEHDIYDLLACGGAKTKEFPNGRPLGTKTIGEMCSLVTQALNKAFKWKLIEENPMEDVTRPKQARKEVDPPSIEEFKKYLDRIGQTRYYAFSVFCAGAGCRRGEALALQINDVNWQKSEVVISKSLCEAEGRVFIKSTKSKKSRRVNLDPQTMDALRDQLARIEREKRLYGKDYVDKGLMFPRPDGEWYAPDKVTARISEFMQAAGIQASLHSLRHMHASMLGSAGVPLTVISSRLGHASPTITLGIYSHKMKSDETKAITVWDEEMSEVIKSTRPAPQKAVASITEAKALRPKREIKEA